MKAVLNKYPTLFSYLLAVILFALVLITSTIIEGPVLKQYFPFTAAVLLFVTTWFLFKTEKKSLQAIGLNFSLRNLSFLPIGVLIGAMAFLMAKFVTALYTGESFAISDSIDYSAIFYAFYFILPTVAVEEFLFRGYLFKKTITTSNAVIANIIFSVLFMLIHVLDEEVLQHKGMMILLMVSIPVGHLLFATALLKSKTLFFPIGLHLGNNWATRHLVTASDTGDSLLYTLNKTTFDTWPSFIGFILIFNGVFLFVTYLIWKWNDLPFTKKMLGKVK